VASNAWDDDVATFVVENLPSSLARVLVIGCGEGALARRMAAAGYEVTAIDPNAPEGPIFEQTTIEEFTTSERFDACVAVLSLHHVDDLDAAVAKITQLLDDRGTLITVEFAWDRFDEATAAWCLHHLTAAEDNEGWLDHRYTEWREAASRGRAVSFADHMREWGTAEGLHPSGALLTALRAHLDEISFAWTPYLYPNLQDTTEDEEAALIEAGRILATGFRFVGARREGS
jgi:SAM-dependent methyltransferase